MSAWTPKSFAPGRINSLQSKWDSGTTGRPKGRGGTTADERCHGSPLGERWSASPRARVQAFDIQRILALDDPETRTGPTLLGMEEKSSWCPVFHAAGAGGRRGRP